MAQNVPHASVKRALFRFRRMLPEYVWDAGMLEGNPFTFPEVKTLLEGVTVGGRKLSDQEQILNLAESSKCLISMVDRGEFALEKRTFCELQGIVARHEALEWGHFRGEGAETEYIPDVALGQRGRLTPLRTLPGAVQLNRVFAEGVRCLERDVPNPFERALAFYHFGALQQFFFDGNKRTSRFMMNGVLMSSGIDAVSIPAARAQEFNSKMVDFYVSRDATEMMAFIHDCHPSTDSIREVGVTYGPVRTKNRDLYSLEAEWTAPSEQVGKMPDIPVREQAVAAVDVPREAREECLRRYHERTSAHDKPKENRGLEADERGLQDDLDV